eukprot:TRINITY_DN2092_c0_g1_i1.p2 TRINITY_DN2092_c0_g1~~TRINITY_DN2092_c0_g1_i1.p2  ORF type:complete len:602 (+),score=194.94 TRINITY_DN2092_c0_g1_i1:87-1808(+)
MPQGASPRCSVDQGASPRRSVNQGASPRRSVDLDKEHAKRKDAAATLRQRRIDALLREKRHSHHEHHGDTAEDHSDTLGQDRLSPSRRHQWITTCVATLIQAIPQLAQQLRSEHHDDQRRAARGVRRLLSQDEGPRGQIVSAGCIPPLVAMLSDQDPILQRDAAWALTNIAGGSPAECDAVVQAGAIPKFVAILATDGPARGHALWALGNIAGDSAAHRDRVIYAGGIQAIVHVLQHEPSEVEARTAAWALCNICRGTPCPPVAVLKGALPALMFLLAHPDKDAAAAACWAIAYVTEGPADHLQAVVDTGGLLPQVVARLYSSDAHVIAPALRILGAVASGDNNATERVVAAGTLAAMKLLLKETHRGIRRDCCWIIGKVCLGTDAHVLAVHDHDLPGLLVDAIHAEESDVRREALFALANFVAHASHDQIWELVSRHRALPAAVDMLDAPDYRTVCGALNAIDAILNSGEWIVAERGGSSPYRAWLREHGGVERIEQLMQHENKEVSEKAQTLIEEYFQGKGEDIPPPEAGPQSLDDYGDAAGSEAVDQVVESRPVPQQGYFCSNDPTAMQP